MMEHVRILRSSLVSVALVGSLLTAVPAQGQVPVSFETRGFIGGISSPFGDRFTPSFSYSWGGAMNFTSGVAIYAHRYDVAMTCRSDLCNGSAKIHGKATNFGIRLQLKPARRVSPWVEAGILNASMTVDGTDGYGRPLHLNVASNEVYGGQPGGAIGARIRLHPWVSVSPFFTAMRFFVNGFDRNDSAAGGLDPGYAYRRIVDPTFESFSETHGWMWGFGLSAKLGISK